MKPSTIKETKTKIRSIIINGSIKAKHALSVVLSSLINETELSKAITRRKSRKINHFVFYL